MKTLLTACLITVFMAAAFGNVAEAAQWTYHPSAVNGWLTVWGTHDCQVVGDPIFPRTYVFLCNHYRGWIAPEFNDYLTRFERDGSNGGTTWHKTAVPYFNPDVLRWRLRPFAEYVETVMPPSSHVTLACLCDTSGVNQEIYCMVNLEVWLTDPRSLQGTYTIVGGACPDLPGYLIGTTPIVFDSLAAQTGNPFSTTPFTGQLQLDGDLSFDPTPIPTLSPWGLFVLFLLVFTAAVIVLRRKRTAV